MAAMCAWPTPTLLLLLLWMLPWAVDAQEARAQRLTTTDYPLARQVLVESIEDEGLVLSSVSDFGQMLRRTDPDVGHGAGNRYAHAEVFAFCSVGVAAQLALEAPEKIAYCPLTMALYQEEAGRPVHLAFRPPGGSSPGARAGLALLERLAARTQNLLPNPNTEAGRNAHPYDR